MSTFELTISFFCLIGGYLGVSWWMNRGTPRPGRPSAGWEAGNGESRQGGIGDPMPWTAVLGVDASADRSAILAAYREKIGQYHPDKVARLGPEIRALAEKKSVEINVAYDAAMKAVSSRSPGGK